MKVVYPETFSIAHASLLPPPPPPLPFPPPPPQKKETLL